MVGIINGFICLTAINYDCGLLDIVGAVTYVLIGVMGIIEKKREPNIG